MALRAGRANVFLGKVGFIAHQRKQCGLFVSFGEHGMGLLPATLGIGSDWTRWRLLRHLLPLYPAPAAWRLSQLAPRLTKSDTLLKIASRFSSAVVRDTHDLLLANSRECVQRCMGYLLS